MLYTREIPDEDVKIVEQYIVSFKDWIDKAIDQKIAARKNDLIKSYISDKVKQGETVTKTQPEIITEVLQTVPSRKERYGR